MTYLIAALFLLLGIVAGGLLVLFISQSKNRAAIESTMRHEREAASGEMRMMEERLKFREVTAQKAESDLKNLRLRHQEIQADNQKESAETIRLHTENQQLVKNIERLQKENTSFSSLAHSSQLELTEMRTRMQESEKVFAEKQEFFENTGAQLKKEFQLLANQIFEKQGATFQEKNKEQLDNVLNPFRNQLSDFRKKVEEVYTDDVKDRTSILVEVRNLQKASEHFNEEVEGLTRALKGDKRLQGNWGELVLERILEESGLRRDHEYEVQHSIRNEDGELKRPDVIIHLPESKDVIIDSKVSLVAYEAALSAEDDTVREVSIRRHLQDIRSHVRRLSDQEYDRLPGIRSLDFVLLFIPIESAFTLAMERDPSIFTEAFEKRLVIVSPTTLMMTLRIIDNVWRYEKRNKNAQEIARRAGALYDKLRVILEDMDQLGRDLGQASRSYDSAYTRMAKGRGNLVRQIEQFRELGANVKRAIPQNIIDDSTEDT